MPGTGSTYPTITVKATAQGHLLVDWQRAWAVEAAENGPYMEYHESESLVDREAEKPSLLLAAGPGSTVIHKLTILEQNYSLPAPTDILDTPRPLLYHTEPSCTATSISTARIMLM